MTKRSRDWNEGLAEDLQDPASARQFLTAAVEEGVPLKLAFAKVIRAMGVKEFATPNAGSHQGEAYRIRSVRDTNAECGTAIFGELPLETVDLGTAYKRGRAHGFAKRRNELLFQLAMRCDEIEKRNRLVSHHVPCEADFGRVQASTCPDAFDDDSE
jgi:hypothetical protein